MVVFAPHNIIKDAPFTKLDLISCRNLVIYFQPPAQKKAMSLFHFGLKTGGILFLGPSESPGELTDEFEHLDAHWKIYRKRRDMRLPGRSPPAAFDRRCRTAADGHSAAAAPEPGRYAPRGRLRRDPRRAHAAQPARGREPGLGAVVRRRQPLLAAPRRAALDRPAGHGRHGPAHGPGRGPATGLQGRGPDRLQGAPRPIWPTASGS